MRVKIVDDRARKYLRPGPALPGDAGLDLPVLEAATLRFGQVQALRTGIAVEIPNGYVGIIRERSGWAMQGVKVLGGVIDSGYRGEIYVVATVLVPEKRIVQPGDRVAQLILMRIALPYVEIIDELTPSARGARGFGSTGR